MKRTVSVFIFALPLFSFSQPSTEWISSNEQSEQSAAPDSGLSIAWRYEADSEILRQEITAFGTVIVSTSKRTVALNAATGEALWTSDDLSPERRPKNPNSYRYKDRDDYAVQNLGPVILLTRSDHIVAFDRVKGAQLWDSDSIGFRLDKGAWELRIDLGLILLWHGRPYGFTTVNALDLMTGQSRWTSKVPLVGEIENLAAQGTQLVFGKGKDRKKAVAAIDLHDGGVLFASVELGAQGDGDKKRLLTVSGYAINNNRDIDLKTVYGYPMEVLHTDDDVMIAFNAETGQITWSTRKIPLDIWVYDSSSVYVAGDGRVFAVSLKDGTIRWSTKKEVERFAMTKYGLLLGCDRYRCQGEIMLVDPRDGHPLWPQNIDLEDQHCSALWKEDEIYFASSARLDRISIPTGNHNQVATFQLEGRERPVLSEGFELPPFIAESKNGIVVSDNKNVLMVGEDGTIRFNEYYSTPGMSFGDIMAKIGGSLAMTALSYASASVTAAAYAKTGFGTGIAFYQTYYPNLTVPSALRLRFQSEMYFYTDRPDSVGREGFSLVRFNVDSGKETARVWLDERRPKFLVDPINGLVLVTRWSNEVWSELLEAVRIQP